MLPVHGSVRGSTAAVLRGRVSYHLRAAGSSAASSVQGTQREDRSSLTTTP